MHAASALESANTRIDTDAAEAPRRAQRHPAAPVRQGRPARRGHARLLGRPWRARIADAEARARSLIQQLAQGTAAHAQAAVAEIERLRAQTDAPLARPWWPSSSACARQTDAQATRALEDMRSQGVRRVAGGVAAPGLHRPAASTRPPTTCARAPRAPPPTCRSSRSACAPRPSACRSSRARAPDAHDEQLRAQRPAARAASSCPPAVRRASAPSERSIATARRAAMRRANEQLRARAALELSACERRDVTPPPPQCPRLRRHAARPRRASPAERRRRATLVARRPAGARLARRGRHRAPARHRHRGHRPRARPHDRVGHLVALPRRPARHHGAQHLHGRGPHDLRRDQRALQDRRRTSAAPSTASSPTSSA